MLKDELHERYGPMMTTDDLAELFHCSRGSIHNKISIGTFEVPTIKVQGRVVSITSDVAAYIDDEKVLQS